MPDIYFVNVWVTFRCNFRCRYCYAKQLYQDKDLDFETADKIVDYIYKTIMPGQTLVVNFHGGEPLLNLDVIKHFILHCERLFANVSFGLTTNGSLINDDTLNYLCEKMTYNLSLSIDGDKTTHELNRKCIVGKIGYNALIESAKMVLGKTNQVRIRMTYDPLTVSQLAHNIIYFIEMGFKWVVPVADFYSKAWVDKDFVEVEKQYRVVDAYLRDNDIHDIHFKMLDKSIKPLGRCSAGQYYYSVDVFGDIFPCTFLVGSEDHCIGNVRAGIDDTALGKIDSVKNQTVDECTGCQLYDSCTSTRCLLANYMVNGSYIDPILVECNLNNIRYRLACGE